MRFPTKFTRTETTLGSDSGPPTTKPGIADNIGIYRFKNIDGFPAQRIVVGYGAPAGAPTLNATLWMWDDTSEAWYKVNSAPQGMVPDALCYFDTPTLPDFTDVNHIPPGPLVVALVVDTDPAIVSGTYTFIMGVDISNPGVSG